MTTSQNKSMQKHVAIIGGGWSGCSAAIELISRGYQVSLFESSNTLGGRARRVEIQGLSLDNGQHILLGAYTEIIKTFKLLRISLDRVFQRLPIQMIYPQQNEGIEFIAPKLPAPLHILFALLNAKGLNADDKMSLVRFSSTARWIDWKLDQDCSVAELMQRYSQTERLCELLWFPLCVAALNTPANQASANIFLSVLRDSLGGKRAMSDMLIPKVDLSLLFPEQVQKFIEKILASCFWEHILKN